MGRVEGGFREWGAKLMEETLYVCMGRRRVWSTCGLAMYAVSPCDQ